MPLGVPGDVFIGYVGHSLPHSVTLLGLAWLAFIVLVVAGASNLYLVSRHFGRRLVTGKTGRVLHLTPTRLARAEAWNQRWGVLTVIFGRHIPGLRIPLTVVAGISRMSYPKFAASVAVSTAVWSGALLLVGAGLTSILANARHRAGILPHMSITTAALLASLVVLSWLGRRRVRVLVSVPYRGLRRRIPTGSANAAANRARAATTAGIETPPAVEVSGRAAGLGDAAAATAQ